jgi:hypothetical protein
MNAFDTSLYAVNASSEEEMNSSAADVRNETNLLGLEFDMENSRETNLGIRMDFFLLPRARCPLGPVAGGLPPRPFLFRCSLTISAAFLASSFTFSINSACFLSR